MATTNTPINWAQEQPALRFLKSRLQFYFPEIRDYDIYNVRNVEGTSTLSQHSFGRAMDIFVDADKPKEKKLGDILFSLFKCHGKNIGVCCAIWNKKKWSEKSRGEVAYTGGNPHTNHIHIEFYKTASQRSVISGLDHLLNKAKNQVDVCSVAFKSDDESE